MGSIGNSILDINVSWILENTQLIFNTLLSVLAICVPLAIYQHQIRNRKLSKEIKPAKKESKQSTILTGDNNTVSVGYDEQTIQLFSIHEKTIDALIADNQAKQRTINSLLNKNILKTRPAESQSKSAKQVPNKETIELLVQKDRLNEADVLVDQILASRKQQKEAIAAESYEAGRVKALQLKYQEALTLFEEASVLVPDDSRYLNEVGVMHLILGRPKKATQFFKQALDSSMKTYGKDHTDE